jgi:two-component system phosphate regulon sensor histidine kinase PhoR
MPQRGQGRLFHRMISLDLQLLLFVLFALLALIAGGAVWLERALSRRRSGRVLGQALEDAPFGVLHLNPVGEAQHANAAAQRLLDLPTSSGPLPAEEWADHLLADAEAAGSRYRLVALPRDRWLRAWISEGSELAFLFDATEQQQAVQASSRLLNDLGHELRTPLATILTHAEVQGLANLPDATRAESLLLLKEETQRAIRLVNAMLDLGRLETSSELVLRPVDLLVLAEAAVQQTSAQAAAKEIHLSLRADTPLPPVPGDADALLRVLLNLLDNAIKYSRPGDQVTLSLQREAAGVRCAVSDTGPGIPAQHLPHVTQRFYRAAPLEQAGSGLGLALVEEALRRHGSALQIESPDPGSAAGVRAHFLLTAARQPEERP